MKFVELLGHGCNAIFFAVVILTIVGIAPPMVVGSTKLTPAELEIWNAPAFQKRFAESYMAETDIEPRVTASERDQVQRVLSLIASDKMDDAAALLQRGRNAASSAVFDFTLANIYFQREQLAEAAAAYTAAVEKFPAFRRAWRNLGLIHVRQGEFEKALHALTRVLELGGNDAILYGLLGYAYSSVDNNLPAESAYRMAILLDPRTLDWKMGLARSLFKQERFAEAVVLCHQLSAEYPERGDLWLLQANAYIGMNQTLKAAQLYELVDHLGQSTPESLLLLGDIYINQDLYEMAVNAYIRAMEIKTPDNPSRFIRSAKALIARGVLDDTRRLIESVEQKYAGRLDSQMHKDILKLRARLAVAEGAGDAQEVAILEQIIALDPLDGEALILLGQHSNRTGQVEKAFFYYERAAAIETFEADAKIRHAQLLVSQGKYAEALPLLRRAQNINPRENIQHYLEQVERVAKTN